MPRRLPTRPTTCPSDAGARQPSAPASRHSPIPPYGERLRKSFRIGGSKSPEPFSFCVRSCHPDRPPDHRPPTIRPSDHPTIQSGNHMVIPSPVCHFPILYSIPPYPTHFIPGEGKGGEGATRTSSDKTEAAGTPHRTFRPQRRQPRKVALIFRHAITQSHGRAHSDPHMGSQSNHGFSASRPHGHAPTIWPGWRAPARQPRP